MQPYVLALDQGTTSSRAVVFDRAGRIRGTGQREVVQRFPQPGWVEHDPEDLWHSQLAAAREALTASGAAPDDIACIGITNQRETAIIWERATGRPVHNAIVWQCRRTAPQVEELRARGHAGLIQRRTGLVPDAYFSATKIAWLLDHIPGARDRAAAGDLAFGTVDTWLIWKLTGGRVHVTDYTNASRTMLLDLDRMVWDPELLALLGVPGSLLPEIRPSVGEFGVTGPEHLGAAIPITGVAGDQQAALFGQACFSPGMAKNTYGTGCFLLLHTGSQRVHNDAGLLATAAATESRAPAYALEGSVFIAGAAVQWLRDGLGLIQHASESEALAATVPDSGGVVVVPAFAGLGAPHWDMYARGLIAGITRGVTRAHIVRATLESIALQTLDVVEAMEAASGSRLHELRVDGGASTNNLLMQMQADILGRPVVRPQITETTALGAAYLAGLGAAVWSDATAVATGWQVDRRFEPSLPEPQRQRLIRDWQRAVQRARGWADA